MVAGVTEDEDKPLTYPLMLRPRELVLIKQVDLLPHLDFDVDRFLCNLDAVNPGVDRLLTTSARDRRGVDEFRASPARKTAPAPTAA